MKPRKKTKPLRVRPKARPKKKPAINAKALLHDVLVHQAELEIQNEELRTVQENLEAAIEKYSNYYDFAPVAYFTLDSRGNVTEANLRGAALLDTPRLQLIGTPFSRRVVPGFRHIFDRLFKEAMVSGHKQKSEFRIQKNNETSILVTAEAVSYSETRNDPSRVRLTLTDITGQRENESRLIEKYSALQTIVDNTDALTFSLDRDFCYTTFNKNHAETMNALYGAEIENGKSILHYMTDGRDRDLARSNLERALKGEQFKEESFYGEDARSRLYYEVAYTPVMNAQGRVTGITLFARNITDNKKAQATLFQEREKLKKVLDAMSDGVCIVGPSGDIEYVNRILEQDFGPVNNQKFDDYLFDGKDPGVWCDRENVLKGSSASWEWTSAKNNRTYELLATPISNKTGDISKLLIFRGITGQREIAGALYDAQSYLDSTGLMMVSLDTRGRVTHINQKAHEILKLPREAVIGKNWFDEFVSKRDRARTHDFYKNLISGKIEPTELLEAAILPVNGDERPYRWVHTLIQEPSGTILGTVSTGTDISEEAGERNQRNLNDDKFRTIVETTLEGIWMYDKEYRISYANDQMAQMLGCDLTDLINRSMMDFLPETEKSYTHSIKDDRRKQGIREKRILRKDGTFFWALESASPLYSMDGDHIGTLGMLTDISLRKQAEESLKTAHVEMSRQVEAQSAEISYRQQALEEIYRIATEPQPSFKSRCDQMIGSLSRLLHLPSMSLHIKQNEELRLMSKAIDGVPNPENCPFPGCRLLGKVADTGQLLHIKGDLKKSYPDCQCNAPHPFRTFLGIPIKNDNGDLIGVICGLDLTERDFSEDELHLIEIFAKYLTHELEQISLEKQLHQNQQLKMLGQLTSGVAHEVRNPLNAITAVTESLFQDIGNKPEYQTHMLHIRNQVERLSNLMVDLLELGRPINKSRLCDVTVASVIAGVMSSWQHFPLKNKCRIQLLQPSLARIWTMKADSVKLQQVFLNLLQNAAQHSPENSEITLNIKPPKNGKITIKIIDKGSGIAPQNMEHMFEPFYTTRKGGTGLGLSIVRHILDVHGGSISLDNNIPLPGLTVKVILNLASDGENERAEL